MLALRGVRTLAFHCRSIPCRSWSLTTTTTTTRSPAPGVNQIGKEWFIMKTPIHLTAAYATNSSKALNSLMLIPKRMDSTAAPKPKIITSANLDTEPKQLTTHDSTIDSPSTMPTKPPSSSSSNTETLDSQSILDNSCKPTEGSEAQSPTPPTPPTATPTPSPTSSNPNPTMPPSKPPPSDSLLPPPNIKMPSREQMEKYFFTALVYVWDFCYYVFCLTFRLIDTYILKNPTLQENWQKLLKRLDEQRQAIKSKK